VKPSAKETSGNEILNKKKKTKRYYRIFSIKRPRLLFQTWHGGPGVSLKEQFIWARHFFKKGLLFRKISGQLCIFPLNLLKVYYTTNKRLRGLFTITSFIPGVYLEPSD